MHYQCLFAIFAACGFLCSSQISGHQVVLGTEKTRRLPNIDVCGKSRIHLGEKVINGRPAELGEYPWMANIGYRFGGSQVTRWGCAGSLITDQYVLTAAHCLHPPLLDGYRVYEVRLGELNLDDTVYDGAFPEDFGIESITYHHEYDNNKKINDIGLIKLDKKIIYTEFIKPICLPPPEFRTNMFVGYSPTVAGWGKSINMTSVKQGTKLLEANIVIQDLEGCRRNITSKLQTVIIDHKVICASSEESDSCKGDSGGPLMFYKKLINTPANSSGNMFLMGIVSYGYYCAVPGYPGVYTRVSEHMTWIIENLVI